MNDSKVLEFFTNVQKNNKVNDNDLQPPSFFKPTLRDYQRKAVLWMLDKEKRTSMFKSNMDIFSGGILADEMGLGKTVEMLCLIASNTPPPEFYPKVSEIKDSEIISTQVSNTVARKSRVDDYSVWNCKQDSRKYTREQLNKWYNDTLNSTSTLKTTDLISTDNAVEENNDAVECYCFKAPPISTLVYCAKCNKCQHAECVHFEPNAFQEVTYLCAECWTSVGVIECKATLVVVPMSILSQWVDEIEKHIEDSSLKVLIYNGVHSDGFIQPFTFNDYDIVVTSYNSIARDFNYVGNDLTSTRLRYAKKYNYPKSPLTCLLWWRICLDEGQSIENLNCKVFEMASCLKSCHKWVMTGTPVQKSLNDLYGLLKFLDLKDYSNRKKFCELMNGPPDDMYSFFSSILWRNTIESVNSELNLPPITYEQHWLTFTQIEKYFYQSQHDVCANDFSHITTRLFTSLNICIKNIDKKKIYNIIAPLYKLRQACVHPQAVNGQFLRIKGTLTMEKLMDVMIDKCRVECNDILRSLVSQHNALAGLYLIREQAAVAVQHYSTVLDLMEKYKDKKLKVDTCQKIHVMYNLTSVIDENKFNVEIIPNNLKNETDLKKDMEQLEKEYLDASQQNYSKWVDVTILREDQFHKMVDITSKTVIIYSDKVANLVGTKTLRYSEWWSDMLDWIFPPKEFLTKVHSDLDEYRVPSIPNIANRLKTMDDVYNTLSSWLDDLEVARTNTISVLKTLEETPMNDLVVAALTCHLRIKSKKSTKNRCLMCRAESKLLAYESLLFSVSNKNKYTPADENKEKDGETMYESTSKGFWKMSQKEFLLLKLFQYGQAKIINTNCLKDAAEHIKVLELVRKEFRYLRLLWTHLSDNLSAYDEIVMAKSRLRLKDTIKQESEENGPLNKRAKKEDNDVVVDEFVDYHMYSLNTEIEITKVSLEKKVGTLHYLENLKKEKENSSELETCPICCLNSDCGWAVLQCGHSICSLCLITMRNQSRDAAMYIVCPMCRNGTLLELVSYVQNSDSSDMPSIKGSYSTKIESITMKLMELIAKEPTVKVLIFSTWDVALTLLGLALQDNSINFRILKTGAKYKKTLKDFKTNNKISALLMQLRLGSKGLNLTEATRVFFMEPVVNKADELQAVARIYRIGQTKPTFVHHFIHRDSIEENITKIFSAEKLEQWDQVTLAQLIRVFERNESNETLQPPNNI